jgi:hypothetical protein
MLSTDSMEHDDDAEFYAEYAVEPALAAPPHSAAQPAAADLAMPRRKAGTPEPVACWKTLQRDCGFGGPRWAADGGAGLAGGLRVATLDTEGNESADWASGTEPTLVQVALDLPAEEAELCPQSKFRTRMRAPGRRRAVYLFAPHCDAGWRGRIRRTLKGAAVHVWARPGDAELAWVAALLPESAVVAQQPTLRRQPLGLHAACVGAGLPTTKAWCDWRRWVRPSHLCGRRCEAAGWEGSSARALPHDMMLYAAADAALQLLLLDHAAGPEHVGGGGGGEGGGGRGEGAAAHRGRPSASSAPYDALASRGSGGRSGGGGKGRGKGRRGRSGRGGGRGACRNGSACHRPDCWFEH